MPPFPGPDGIYEKTGYFNLEGLDLVRKRFQVPVALWCNWPVARQKIFRSANFLPDLLLDLMSLRPSGTLALSASIYSRFPVLSKYVETADGRFFEPMADDMPHQSELDNYRLIEYDLLLGNQYAVAASGWGW